jgi:hypothetical protein
MASKPPKTLTRDAKLAAALSMAGMTRMEFAAEVGGVSRTQLRRVLDDPKQSRPLTEIIDKFVRDHVGGAIL